MNSIVFFIAWRSLLASTYEKIISPIVLICFISIFIGSFSLALVTAIMHGFEVVVHEKLQGIQPQITIISPHNQQLNINTLKPILEDEFPEICAWSPSTTRYALILTENTNTYSPTVITLKAINPTTEHLINKLQEKISKPSSSSLPLLLQSNKILIGKSLADSLDLTLNNTVELLFPDEAQLARKKFRFDSMDAVVSGIFDSGIDEFDSTIVFCSFDFLEILFPESGIEQINLKLKPNSDEKKIIEQLRSRLNLAVYSWKDFYKPLVSALKLEKWVSFFILALITLVASMSIISLLFMQIMQKRPEIAILKAMGMMDRTVTHIFLLMGMSITVISSLSGLFCAWIASWLLNHYPFIKLPDVYYVSYLPVKMEWYILLAVFVVVSFFGFIATWIPTRRTKNINIATVLRFEG
jgi:lipoprotein-releasing system permease protein